MSGAASAGGSLDPAVLALRRAVLLCEAGRWEEARRAAGEALAADPGNGHAHLVLARAQLALGDFAGGLDAANRGLAVEPAEEWGHRLASAALWGLGQLEESVRAAHESVRCAPHVVEAHVSLASALCRVRRGAEALDVARRAVELDPLSPQAHQAVAVAADVLGDRELERRALRRVLELDPQNAVAHNDLGVELLTGNDIGAAARSFGAALASDPQSSVARTNLDVVALALARRLYLFGLLLLGAGLLALGVESAVGAAGVDLPVRLLTGSVGFALVGLWARRTWRDVPVALRRPIRRRMLRRPLLLLAWLLTAVLAGMGAALALLPRDVAPAALAPLGIVGFLNVAFLVASRRAHGR